MKVLNFPEDFKKTPHRIIPGATQWFFSYGNDDEDMISIVGGGMGINGNGITTFEMWDTKNMIDPRGYLSSTEINQWLQDHPIEEGS